MNPLETIEAEIQAIIGKFMTNKARLLRLAKSDTLTIQTEAEVLYTRQLALERDLKNIQEIIDRAKEGIWSVSDTIKAAGFYQEINEQMDNIDYLEEHEKRMDQYTEKTDFKKYIPWAGVGLITFLFFRRFK